MISIATLQVEQIDKTIALHKAAFSGYLNTRLGNLYIHAFLQWFQEAEEGIALCAMTEDGDIVGYVVGAPLGYASRLTAKTLRPALLGIMIRPWLFFDAHFRSIITARFQGLFYRANRGTSPSVQPLLPHPVFSLVGIAVSPLARGQRIGQQLMDAFEREVVERRGKTMQLSVYPDNVAARKLYERSDWQPYKVPQDVKQAMYYFKIIAE